MTEATESAGDVFLKRSPKYGERVRTYRDPELAFEQLESLRLSLQLRAVDLAAGQGDGSRHLRALGTEITYVDRSASMLAQGVARGHFEPHECIEHDIAHLPLPFAEGAFDIALIRYALHDVQDTLSFFSEVARILTISGVLQIVDMCGSDSETTAFLNRIHSLKTLGPAQPTRVLDRDVLINCLADSGLTVFDMRWYRSEVSAGDWLGEDQIGPDRLELLRTVAIEWAALHPRQADGLKLRTTTTDLELSIPVVVLSARKSTGARNEQ